MAQNERVATLVTARPLDDTRKKRGDVHGSKPWTIDQRLDRSALRTVYSAYALNTHRTYCTQHAICAKHVQNTLPKIMRNLNNARYAQYAMHTRCRMHYAHNVVCIRNAHAQCAMGTICGMLHTQIMQYIYNMENI